MDEVDEFLAHLEASEPTRERRRYDDIDGPGLASAPPRRYRPSPALRLVLSGRAKDCPLGKAQRLAVCEPTDPVSIGRDRGFEPQRLRLCELAVSKTHATLFVTAAVPEDEQPAYWSIIDYGSTHGSFISRDKGSGWDRLSEPKIASKPKRIEHLDRLRIGSSIFTAHVHSDWPSTCTDCNFLNDEERIPLNEAEPKVASTSTSTADAQPWTPSFRSLSRDDRRDVHKSSMRELKASLTAPKPVVAPLDSVGGPSRPYVDRAKMRRQAYGVDEDGPPPSKWSRNGKKPYGKSGGPATKDTSGGIRAAIPVTVAPVGGRGRAMLEKLSGPLNDTTMRAPVEAMSLGAERAGIGSRAAVGIETMANNAMPGASRWQQQSADSTARRWRESNGM